MKRGPIGVWFSVALAILLASGWVGTKMGRRAAVYWVSHQKREQEQKYGAARVHLDAELDTLFFVDVQRIFVVDGSGLKIVGEKTIFRAVNALQYFAEHPEPPDLKPVLDLELGLADLRAASVEEQGNQQELAESHRKSAQTIFQSLGWRDTSDQGLRDMMENEFDRFYAPRPAAEPAK